jgi:glycosyltransferase involved in cell wall biosynthesis
MKLSILICTIPSRVRLLNELIADLTRQSNGYDVEILTNRSPGTIGAKRQTLLQTATGDYVTFIDDDDDINPQYIKLIFAHLGTCDVIGFEGEITTNGRNKKRFTISKEHPYEEKGGVYYRYNNHLSPIRREIALKVGYKDMQFAEDFDYAMRLKESGLIQTEKYIYTPMYFYRYRTNKRNY